MKALSTACLVIVASTLVGACSSAGRWEKPAATPTVNAPVSSDMTRTKRGNPPFYEVFGVRYHVLNDSIGYSERGVASWYGKKFHGRLTSNGEQYDMYSMTAAHKTLPLPTNVKVTNLNNGRSVIVRVNDRGPFVKNRVIDLSYAAARELDMIGDGTAPVEITALDTSYTGPVTAAAAPSPAAESRPRPAAEPRMYLQVGAFGEPGNARTLASLLSNNGVQRVAVQEPGGEAPPLYRVRIGPFSSVTDYDRIVAQVEMLQIAETHLVVENDTMATSQ